MYIVCINFTKEVKEECACKHLKDRNSLYDFYIPPKKMLSMDVCMLAELTVVLTIRRGTPV